MINNLLITEKTQSPNETILIVDRENFLGSGIIKSLGSQANFVYVSSKHFNYSQDQKNVSYIHFNFRTLTLPDIFYSVIVIVCRDKDTLNLLPKLLGKAGSDNSKAIVILDYKDQNQTLIEKILSIKNTSIVFLGDVFGGEVKSSKVEEILRDAHLKERICLEGMGQEKIYPVFYEDTINFILNISFSLKLQDKLFYAYPKHAATELSLARILQKINPLIKIDFSKEREKNQELKIQKGELDINQIELEKKIRDTMEKHKTVDKNFWDENDFEKKDVAEDREKPKIFKSFFYFIVFVFFLPFIILGFSSLIGAKTITASFMSLKNGDLQTAKRYVSVSRRSFYLANASKNVLNKEISLILKNELFPKIQKKIEIGEKASESLFNLILAAETVKDMYSGKDGTSEDFLETLVRLKESQLVLQEFSALKEFQDLVGDNNQILTSPILNLSDAFPYVLGFGKEKTYLVLFQNNMELRPGGGFIGSYGLLKINSGKVAGFTIHDVYDADGQLKGHIEPPFAIRRYIPLVHSYLRDSNFSIDFSKSASVSAFMLNQETGRIVDGVIAVDVTFLKKILKAIGPVKVIDYNEVVDEKNLYITTQKHSEKNFFSGSSQKKDFLRSLFSSLSLQLSNNKNIPYIDLLKVMDESIREKHLLFAFSDKNAQKLFSANNMSSSVFDERKKDKKIINDFLGISEANLGVNKANYFVARKLEQNIFVGEDGSVSAKLTINYRNDSDKWPGGDYKNYLRVIVPLGSVIKSVAIDGKDQKIIPAITDPSVYEVKEFKSPVGLELERTEEEGKSVIGFLINVPKGKYQKIEINYLLKDKVVLEDSFSYNLRYFKQPGTEEYEMTIFVFYPSGYKAYDSKEANVFPDKAYFNQFIKSDFDLGLSFSKK